MCPCGGEMTVWCFDCGDDVCDDCGCREDHGGCTEDCPDDCMADHRGEE